MASIPPKLDEGEAQLVGAIILCWGTTEDLVSRAIIHAANPLPKAISSAISDLILPKKAAILKDIARNLNNEALKIASEELNQLITIHRESRNIIAHGMRSSSDDGPLYILGKKYILESEISEVHQIAEHTCHIALDAFHIAAHGDWTFTSRKRPKASYTIHKR